MKKTKFRERPKKWKTIMCGCMGVGGGCLLLSGVCVCVCVCVWVCVSRLDLKFTGGLPFKYCKWGLPSKVICLT